MTTLEMLRALTSRIASTETPDGREYQAMYILYHANMLMADDHIKIARLYKKYCGGNHD